jgi:hypothetical protein
MRKAPPLTQRIGRRRRIGCANGGPPSGSRAGMLELRGRWDNRENTETVRHQRKALNDLIGFDPPTVYDRLKSRNRVNRRDPLNTWSTQRIAPVPMIRIRGSRGFCSSMASQNIVSQMKTQRVGSISMHKRRAIAVQKGRKISSCRTTVAPGILCKYEGADDPANGIRHNETNFTLGKRGSLCGDRGTC